MKKTAKKEDFLTKIKRICSITVKNEGRALNIIFVLCIICIFFFSIHLFRVSTNFYERLDATMENNINLNIEIMTNERMENIEARLDLL